MTWRDEIVQADEQRIKYFAFAYPKPRNADLQGQRDDAHMDSAVGAGQTD